MAQQQGKGGTLVLPQQNQNPLEQLQAKYKGFQVGFKDWLSKQSIAVEATVVTAISGVQGGAIGGIMGALSSDVTSSISAPPQAGMSPQAMASFQQAQSLTGGPWIQARNFAVMTGTNAGISCVMKRLRGKDDVESSMVAAFGSGALFSIVSGFGGPNIAQNAITSGVFFALVQGGIFKIGEKFAKGKSGKAEEQDIYYSKTRSMLNNLGLHHYESNFKKGLLTDYTLPLLTDSALKEVKIPPGPRLLILDHIQREPEFQEKRKY